MFTYINWKNKRILSLVIVSFFLISELLLAQEFTVEKVKGKVLVQKGVKENFYPIKRGDVLSGSNLILTEENSFIQLKKGNNRFILNSNSALGLSYIREISINDLLLALAMEEIRNVPKNKSNGIEKNTAVYGAKVTTNSATSISTSKLGLKKINGAKQLAKSGFTESAIIVSKDVFRKYPETKKNFSNRIYFANLLDDLSLYNEALDEYKSIKKLELSANEKLDVDNKIEKTSVKLMNK